MLSQLILGHLFGDYMFQPKAMALNKTKKTWRGAGVCALHSAIYTFFIALATSHVHPLFLLMIFMTHYVPDRLSLGMLWLKMIRGRTWETTKDEWDVAFTAIVYAVVDNTIHITLMLGVMEVCKWAHLL